MTWEEFEELEGCKVGCHTNVKEKVELWKRDVPEMEAEPIVKKNKVDL